MAYGLNIKNSNGNVIIDQDYKNYSEYLSMNYGRSMNNIYNDPNYSCKDVTGIDISLDLSATPVAALQISGTAQYKVDMIPLGFVKNVSNIATMFRTAVVQHGDGVSGWESYTFHQYVFKNGFSTGGAGDYGLHVYDGSGSLIYNSRVIAFDIYSITSGISLSTPPYQDPLGNFPASPPAGTYYDVSHPGISNPYYVIYPYASWLKTVNEDGCLWKTALQKLSPTSVRVKWAVKRGVISDNYYNIDEGWNPNLTLIILKSTL